MSILYRYISQSHMDANVNASATGKEINQKESEAFTIKEILHQKVQ